ncbi:hypothetical protein M9H77_34915 [Catharanthus roseus]|uniref:Uncharacterized protein n=1 Tax=Catharanthus roseus TaxID=4058 RepID=A0ACB9ZR60_CATRO|nr:hypothetical protein M9H77_34915 [Catharanthus roseus]
METNRRLRLMNLLKDFFSIKFHLIENYNKALHEGPWFFGQHFIAIRYFNSTTIWACFLELPPEFYDLEIVRKVGNILGTLLGIDDTTRPILSNFKIIPKDLYANSNQVINALKESSTPLPPSPSSMDVDHGLLISCHSTDILSSTPISDSEPSYNPLHSIVISHPLNTLSSSSSPDNAKTPLLSST